MSSGRVQKTSSAAAKKKPLRELAINALQEKARKKGEKEKVQNDETDFENQIATDTEMFNEELEDSALELGEAHDVTAECEASETEAEESVPTPETTKTAVTTSENRWTRLLEKIAQELVNFASEGPDTPDTVGLATIVAICKNGGKVSPNGNADRVDASPANSQISTRSGFYQASSASWSDAIDEINEQDKMDKVMSAVGEVVKGLSTLTDRFERFQNGAQDSQIAPAIALPSYARAASTYTPDARSKVMPKHQGLRPQQPQKKFTETKMAPESPELIVEYEVGNKALLPNFERAMEVRREINARLTESTGLEIRAVSRTMGGNIRLTGMQGTTAAALKGVQDVWMPVLEDLGGVVGASAKQTWGKIIIHGVPVAEYRDKMEDLEHELTRYSGLTCMKTPRWLPKAEALKSTGTSSIVVYLPDKREAAKVIKKGILLGHLKLRATEYISFQATTLCGKCQKFGHGKSACRAPARCGRCGGGHLSTDCVATQACCPNCKGAHEANDKACPERPTLQNDDIEVDV